MARKIWGTVHEAAAILSANAGRTISPRYVRLLASSGHVKVRAKDGRTNEYYLDDCRKYIVKQKTRSEP